MTAGGKISKITTDLGSADTPPATNRGRMAVRRGSTDPDNNEDGTNWQGDGVSMSTGSASMSRKLLRCPAAAQGSLNGSTLLAKTFVVALLCSSH